MRTVLAWVLLLVAASPSGANPRDASAVRAEYVEVWTRLVAAKIDVGEMQAAVAASDDLRRAWALMGERLTIALRRRPSATADELRAELRSLNPEDTVAVCESSSSDEFERYAGEVFCSLARFAIDADVLEIEPTPRSVFAVAVRYSYFGRLLVVSPAGLATSEDIGRCGVLHSLPSAAAGHRRFYAYSRCDDWPTSCCGGGDLSLWTWDGRSAVAAVRGTFNASRPGCSNDPRNGSLYVHGRWLKLYGRRFLRTFSEGCPGAVVQSIWKIQLDDDGVRNLGQQLVVPEYQVADRLIARVLHGGNAEKLASADAVRSLRTLLARTTWLGFAGGRHVERTPGRTRFVLLTDEASLTLTIERRHQRPFVVAVEEASPDDRAMATAGARRAMR
jgi:hypothetical protein